MRQSDKYGNVVTPEITKLFEKFIMTDLTQDAIMEIAKSNNFSEANLITLGRMLFWSIKRNTAAIEYLSRLIGNKPHRTYEQAIKECFQEKEAGKTTIEHGPLT